jgi:uncharacterized membrane protein
LAAIAGACFIGVILRSVATKDPSNVTGVLPHRFSLGQDDTIAVVIGGVFGAFIDSILGATIQSRRWCETCCSETERDVHSCGTATTQRRGFGWLDNDVVNFLATLSGGLLAALLAR